MKTGSIDVICGQGGGKTALALGKGLLALTRQKRVIVIQFLKGSYHMQGLDQVKGLEPGLKVFRFEKSDQYYEELTEEEKREEEINIRNGFHFARKVIGTGECDLLILDEILGILDRQIITPEEFAQMIALKAENMQIILTGKVFPESLRGLVDSISTITYTEVDKS